MFSWPITINGTVVWTDLTVEQLQHLLHQQGYKPLHARRLLRHFYSSNGSFDFSAMDVPIALQRWLADHIASPKVSTLARTVARDGTTKLLLRYADGSAVETVVMPDFTPDRAALCVSSQIGCAMGCDFCASTAGGLVRNLEAHEIVEQYLLGKIQAVEMGRRITSLVFMGMGEPMHNLDSVLKAIRIIADPDAGGLGWRQVTVSTVGIIAGIDRLAAEDLNVHLAVSLHAPDDETRSKIIPTAKRFKIEDIIAAAKRFYQRTGRVVTIEYCLLDGVNDSDEQAIQLATLLAGFRAHVNVIPYNAISASVSGMNYQRPAPERVDRFVNLLRERNAVAHVRRARGDDENAACGQLRLTVIRS